MFEKLSPRRGVAAAVTALGVVAIAQQSGDAPSKTRGDRTEGHESADQRDEQVTGAAALPGTSTVPAWSARTRFRRHRRAAVLYGRLTPLVRSMVSVGAWLVLRMHASRLP